MLELIREHFAHQEWADAAHWRAFEAHAGALADPALRERLHHLHLVQHAFFALWRGEAPRLTQADEFAAEGSLRSYAREYYRELPRFLAGLDAAGLGTKLTVPWFKDPPLDATLGQTMLQVVFHSHYHRGQNATRLKELGGKPPTTDLIVWYWKGRPAPRWP